MKNRLINELLFIKYNKGVTLEDLKLQFKIQRATVQGDIKQLKNVGWVDFFGPPKSGKYMLTNKGEKIFNTDY